MMCIDLKITSKEMQQRTKSKQQQSSNSKASNAQRASNSKAATAKQTTYKVQEKLENDKNRTII